MSAHTDATFLRKFLIMLGALVAFTIFVLLTANLVTAAAEAERDEDPRVHDALLERIQPVGKVNVAEPPAPPAAAEVEPAAPAAAGLVEAAADETESTTSAAAEVVEAVADKAESAASAPAEVVEAVADEAESAASAAAEVVEDVVDEAESAASAAAEVVEDAVDGAESAASASAEVVEDVVDGAESAASAAAEAAEGAADEAVSAVPAAAAVAAAAPAAQAEGATGERVDLERGKYVYDTVCFACHMVGLAGAPKLGDKAAWDPRVAQGMNALLSSALNGKGAMPPKGGRSDLSDADIAAAITYMVGQVK